MPRCPPLPLAQAVGHLLAQTRQQGLVATGIHRQVLPQRIEFGQRDRQALIVDPLPAAEIEALKSWLAARGHSLASVEQPRARLDQLFLSKVARPGRAGGSSAGVGSNEVPLDAKP